MKRKLSVIALVFVTILLLFSMLAMSASAKPGEGVHLALEGFETRQGETFTTVLSIPDGADIVDFDYRFLYNTEYLTLVSAEPHADVRGTLEFSADEAGVLAVNYTKTNENVRKYTPLLVLTFRTDKYLAPGSYEVLIPDATHGNVVHRLTGGMPTEVTPSLSLAKLNIYHEGDVNLDGSVNIADVTVLRRYLAHLTTLSDFQRSLADVYVDGETDIADAVALQRRLAGLEVPFGTRESVRFVGRDGLLITEKSVLRGEGLAAVPAVPELEEWTNGRWSASSTEYIPVDFGRISSSLSVYAVYDRGESKQLKHYRDLITERIAALHGSVTSDIVLPTALEYDYDLNYRAVIRWSTSDANALSGEGKYLNPTYDTEVTLSATIHSYYMDEYQGSTVAEFPLTVEGAYSTPTKAEIAAYLRKITGGTLSADGSSSVEGGRIESDLNLIRRLSNAQVNSTALYEVQIDWLIDVNGVWEPISRIKRATTEQTGVNLAAVVSFNGSPLGGDGRIYFYDVTLSAITEEEIRYYIIGEVAAGMKSSLSSGDPLFATDNRYGCSLKWVSGNADILTVSGNTVSVNPDAVNGVACPLTLQVSYMTDAGAKSFELYYTVSVVTENENLVAGTNIDPSLYHALRMILDVKGILTTGHLKNTKLVYLDLSSYADWFENGAGELVPPVTDLTGLTYCENLRVLNISGLKIEGGLNQLATLSSLEALIAKDCGITDSTFSSGGVSVLGQMTNLKLLDLSGNDLTTLDGILSDGVVYNKLTEVYLADNMLTDISALTKTPLLSTLVLSENALESNALEALKNLVCLTYLSLADNGITELSALSNLTALTELRLQRNAITDPAPLKKLTALTALYLGDNAITGISQLADLVGLKTLFLNNNRISDVSALEGMTRLEVLNLSDNTISDLRYIRTLAPSGEAGSADCYSGLRELYAERNELRTFAFAANLTGLEKLLLAGNPDTDETLNLSGYFGGLTSLRVLTLSGKRINSLEFLENSDGTYKPLVRLELNGCHLPAFYAAPGDLVEGTGEDGTPTVTVSKFEDNLLHLAALSATLRYLDIGNNGLAVETEDMVFANEKPSTLDSLRALWLLEVLYADNTEIGSRITALIDPMSGITHLSLESCGITDTAWLSTFGKAVFLDLAGNPIERFAFANVKKSVETLTHLYLDTTSETAMLGTDGHDEFKDNKLVALSLSGLGFSSVDSLPDMEAIEWLDLSDTGLVDFLGTPDGDYYYNALSRYATLRYLDVAESAVSIFKKANLEHLYEHFAGIYVNLYADEGRYAVPAGYERDGVLDAKKESAKLLELIDNMVKTVKVAEEGISDNNPALMLAVGDYTILWTVSNTTNYSIDSGKLALVDDTALVDETLVFTARVESIYGTTETADARIFEMATDVVRLADAYVASNSSGVTSGAVVNAQPRGGEFRYDFCVIAAATEGFATLPVTPVNYTVNYTYSAVDASGNVISYTDVLEVVSISDHTYRVKDSAPLHAKVTIMVAIVCHEDVRYNMTKICTVEVSDTAYTLTFVPNGGTVYNTAGDVVTKLTQSEESVLFFSESRMGYTFAGWYTDPSFTNRFTALTMPSENTTIYAKWTANQYTVKFDPNVPAHGSAPTETMEDLLCVYGTASSLPTNTLGINGWVFKGWATSPVGSVVYADGATVENLTSVPNGSYTLYAVWEVDPLTVSKHVKDPISSSVDGREFQYYVVSDTDGGNSYTVYVGIENTPWAPPTGKSIIDWSASDPDVANYQGIRPLPNWAANGNRWWHMDIYADAEEVYFIGDPSKEYTAFRIVICQFFEGQDLTLHFSTFNFYGDGNAIGLYQCEGFDLTIDVNGACAIGTNEEGATVLNITTTDLTVTGSGILGIYAGHGAKGSSAGADGQNGGIGIVAENITVDMTGSLFVYGGNGGDGKAGANGTNATGNDNPGGDGGNGGNGGIGASAVVCTSISVSETSSVVFTAGNGGVGGAGGRGGDGSDDDAPASARKGKGGNGGNGGNGGACSPVVAVSSSVIPSEINCISGTVGAGGRGGNGGNGGDSKGWFGGVGAAGGNGGTGGLSGDGVTRAANGSTGKQGA